MGRFFNSFKGQLGRDTGRLVSNFVYGDKHAAPYRRVEPVRRKKKKTEVGETSIEADGVSSGETLWSSIGKAFNGGENEEEKLLRKKMEALKDELNSRIDELNQIQTPQEEQELVSFLLELSTLLSGNKGASENVEETDMRNRYTDLLLDRFGQGLEVMEIMFPDNRMLPMFRKTYKSFKKQRSRKKYLVWTAILLGGSFFLYVLLQCV